MQTLRRLIANEHGVTFAEMLVVALLIGVLGAIGMPTLLAARSQAGDAPAKELVRAAELTAETVAVDAGGSYATITPALLHRYEPTIPTNGRVAAYLSRASGSQTGYTLTVTSSFTGDTFTLTRVRSRPLARTCTIPTRRSPNGGCERVVGTRGTW